MYSGRAIEDALPNDFNLAGRQIGVPAAVENAQQFERSLQRLDGLTRGRDVGLAGANLVDQPATAPDGQIDNRFMQRQSFLRRDLHCNQAVVQLAAQVHQVHPGYNLSRPGQVRCLHVSRQTARQPPCQAILH